ncbi:MAG: alpha/beta hydrolase [Cyanobacteria bacterium]|nr:alpha/beta hydrolase [Cyanobacteriota bacterium]
MTQLAQNANPTTGFITVNGTELYYEDTGGQGEPILFSHALLLDCKSFAPQVAALKNRYRCISFDFRGQGRSAEDSRNAIGMDVLTADVVALIEKLQIGPVHFCGLSMGGFVGIRLAARHPHLVRSLVLMGSSADEGKDANQAKFKVLNFIARWAGPASVARAVAPIMLGKSTLNDPARQTLKADLIDQLSNNRRSIWRAVNGVLHRDGFLEEVSKILAPTLVIVGEEDVCMVPSMSARLASAIGGARLVQIPRSGHTITIEQPTQVNVLIEEFLGQVGNYPCNQAAEK